MTSRRAAAAIASEAAKRVIERLAREQGVIEATDQADPPSGGTTAAGVNSSSGVQASLLSLKLGGV